MIRCFDDATDRDTVMDVWFRASRVGHPFLSENELRQDAEIVRDRYLPSAQMYIYEENGRILGFIGLLDNFIGGLFVDPEVMRHGIGRQLVEYARKIKGPLHVEVYAQNPAIRFYENCGFEETDRRPLDGQGRPLEIVVMDQESNHLRKLRRSLTRTLTVLLGSLVPATMLGLLIDRFPVDYLVEIGTLMFFLIGIGFCAILYGFWTVWKGKSFPAILKYGSAVFISIFLFLGRLMPGGELAESDVVKYLFVGIVLSLPICSLLTLTIAYVVVRRRTRHP